MDNAQMVLVHKVEDGLKDKIQHEMHRQQKLSKNLAEMRAWVVPVDDTIYREKIDTQPTTAPRAKGSAKVGKTQEATSGGGGGSFGTKNNTRYINGEWRTSTKDEWYQRT